MSDCYDYGYFDLCGTPRYIGESGRGGRIEEHVLIAEKVEGKKGDSDFYRWLRAMKGGGYPIRRKILYHGLDKTFAFAIERALLTKLRKLGEGGVLLNRNGYYCEPPEARAFIERDHKWRRRKWRLPALAASIRVSEAALTAFVEAGAVPSHLDLAHILKWNRRRGYDLWLDEPTLARLDAIKDDGTHSNAMLRLAEMTEKEAT